jgi:hypothetical protein
MDADDEKCLLTADDRTRMEQAEIDQWSMISRRHRRPRWILRSFLAAVVVVASIIVLRSIAEPKPEPIAAVVPEALPGVARD